jgi:hypothetical protein
MKAFRLGAASTTTLMALAAPAFALSIDIEGVLGSGTTNWTFSGSQSATGDGVFGELGGDPLIDVQSQFLDVGDFATVNLLTAAVTSGTASVTVAGAATSSLNILNVFIDDDTPGADDIGFDFGGPTLSFASGDTITFAGTVSVALDLSLLNAGGFPFAGTSGSSTQGLNPALSVDVTITETPAVPLPASLPALLAGLGAFGGLGLRRRLRG